MIINILFSMLGSQQDPQEFVSYKVYISFHHHRHHQRQHHFHHRQHHRHRQHDFDNFKKRNIINMTSPASSALFSKTPSKLLKPKESFDFFDWNNNGKISYGSLQVFHLKLFLQLLAAPDILAPKTYQCQLPKMQKAL